MMYFADDSCGRNYSKDPAVVHFKGKYYLYYSVPPSQSKEELKGWSIGVAVSEDLENWSVAGRLQPEQEIEKNGFCAPGAMVFNQKVHLFYQSYGNFPADKICHAVSEDGLHFQRNPKNPIFSPIGSWNNGRAIDADVIADGRRLLMYYATRDPSGKIQMLGVCEAPLDSDYGPEQWKQLGSGSILKPKLAWERQCIEAPAVCKYDGRFYVFYGGGYNNQPQQIGCAVSQDGVTFRRLQEEPFLPNGRPGEWNSSESGHPFVFQDTDGRWYLFYQGNGDDGKTWYISKREFLFREGKPALL